MAVQEVDLGKVVGSDGKSAYQSAVEAGYTGTEAEFYAALVTLQDAPFVPSSGGEVNGPLLINGNGSLMIGSYTNFPSYPATIRYGNASGGSGARIDISQTAPDGSTTGRGIRISGVDTPYANGDSYNMFVANKKYVDDNKGLPVSGGDMEGMIDMQNNILTGVPDPVSPADAVNFHSLVLQGLTCVPLLVELLRDSEIIYRGVVYGTLAGFYSPGHILLHVFGKLETINQVDISATEIRIYPPSYASLPAEWSGFGASNMVSVVYNSHTTGGTETVLMKRMGGSDNYYGAYITPTTSASYIFSGILPISFGSLNTDWGAPL